MEKWKVIVIMLLIGILGGYGFFQQSGMGKIGGSGPDQSPVDPNPQKNMVGQPLPAWNIPAKYWLNTAKPVVPADLKGKVVLLEFFRIDCPHCQEAAPMMEQLYKTYSPRGMKMVAIQAPGADPKENDWSQVKTALKTWGLEYPIAFDEKSRLFKSQFGGKSYPSVYLVDKQGVVRYQHTGHTDQKVRDLTAVLETMLK